MRIQIIEHPLVAHKLTFLRDRNMLSSIFRQLVDELVTLLAYEATRDVAVREIDVVVPVALTKGLSLAYPRPILVSILRAGLGMPERMLKLLPTAKIGLLGIKCDEIILETHMYANRLPGGLPGRQCYVVDPMFATGHTPIDAVNYLLEHGACDVTHVRLLAAPEGLRNLEEAIGDRADVTIVSAALGERLNENGYIVPGLGDAGDRLYGIVDWVRFGECVSNVPSRHMTAEIPPASTSMWSLSLSGIFSIRTDRLRPTWIAMSFAFLEDDGGSPPGRPDVAVLVHEADAGDPAQKSGAAALYLSGLLDSFFHVEQAAASREVGVPLVGLDVRRCGRFVRSNASCDGPCNIYVRKEEIGLVIGRLCSLGAGRIALTGHSTGGLQATLWAAGNPGMVDAVALNSSWLDHNGDAFERGSFTRFIDRVGARRPRLVFNPLSLRYARALHTDFSGEFSFDPRHKPFRRAVAGMGFIRTVRRVQARTAVGDVKIDAPLPVAHSDASSRRLCFPDRDDVTVHDAVLGVEDMRRLAPLLSKRIDILKIPGGRRDLVLSVKPAREAYIRGVVDWVCKTLGL